MESRSSFTKGIPVDIVSLAEVCQREAVSEHVADCCASGTPPHCAMT
jgi:hypothetical protein